MNPLRRAICIEISKISKKVLYLEEKKIEKKNESK